MQLSYFDFIKKPEVTDTKLFIVTGDEPLQRHNVVEKIITAFKDKNYEIARHDLTEQNHNDLYHEADSLNLFAMDKLVQFSLEKPPQKSLQQALVQNILKPSDNVYLLIFNGIKKQTLTTKWFQNLATDATHIHIYQPNIANAVNIINHELEQSSLSLDREAVQVLAQKTEGNLIATKQILKLLSRQDTSSFDAQSIKPFLHEHASFDVFDLSDAILMRQKAKSLTILNSILTEKDKPPLILWTIKKELRIVSQLQATQQTYHQKIFKDNNVWASKQKFYSSMANRLNKDTISQNLKKCLDIDLCIKGAIKGNISLKLNEVVFDLVS
ncbi:DNA polymerase III subunit delta [Francisellaceae bacterium CB300]